MFMENLQRYFDFDWKIEPKTQDLDAIMKRINDVMDLRNVFEELQRGIHQEEIFKDLYEVSPFASIG